MSEWKNHDLVEVLNSDDATRDQKRKAIDLLLSIYENKLTPKSNVVDLLLENAEHNG